MKKVIITAAITGDVLPMQTQWLPITPQQIADESVRAADAGAGAVTLPPKTGVELVAVDERDGTKYYTLRDLRNGNLVQNVTRSSARRLWRYAITEHETRPIQADQIKWQGSLGLWKSYRRMGRKCYDLVQREEEGKMRLYYGVTDDGIHDEWRQIVGGKAAAAAES